MKVFKRIVTPEKAKELKAAFESCCELAHIKKIGEGPVPRGKYSYKIIFQSWRGGNEWSPKRLVTQFEVCY